VKFKARVCTIVELELCMEARLHMFKRSRASLLLCTGLHDGGGMHSVLCIFGCIFT
jgi:hypothetical protein